MSSIEQLGKDRWRARWRDPGGRQKAKTFTQKDFADNHLRAIDAASGLFDDDLDGVAERLDADPRVYSMCTDASVVPRTAESAGR